MKGKFKKLIAGAAVLAMAAQFALVLPASAADEYYKQDFEQETAHGSDNNKSGDKQGDDLTLADGVKCESDHGAGFMSIAQDSNSAINMHYKFAISGASGTRGARIVFNDDAKQMDDEQRSVFEMDFSISANSGQNQLVLADSGQYGRSKTNTPFSGNYAVAITQTEKDKVGVQYLGTGEETAAAELEGYTNGTWAHLKAVMNFQEDTVVMEITSLDGETKYLDENKFAMKGDNSFANAIVTACDRYGSGVIKVDNIVFRPYKDGDIKGKYYMATFEVDDKTISKTADKTTGKIDSVPETKKTGYIFKGWAKDGDETVENLMTDEEVLEAQLTADVTYKAIYEKDPQYVEPMVDVKLTIPTNGLLTMGTDDHDYVDNNFSVQLIGELGNDLYEQKETRVNPVKVDWKFDGFTTMVNPTDGTSQQTEDVANADGTYQSYCGGYGRIVYDEENPTVANFTLANQASNYYGRVTVTVTYGGGDYIDEKTITKQAAIAILANTTQPQDQYLPKAGYISDFKWYADDMVGYQATVSGDNKGAVDVTTGDWAVYGGNNGRSLSLASEGEGAEATKFLKLKATGNNSSCFAVNKLATAPAGQVIISQDVRFYTPNTTIMFKTDNPVTWTDNATTLSLNYTGDALTMNGKAKVADVTAGTWYHIVLSCDVTSKLWYAKVYDMEGKLLGESEAEAFVNAGSTSPTYLCYRTPDNSTGEFDFNNVKMYVPTIDGELTTTVSNDTLIIPSDTVDATDGIKYADGTVTVNKADAADGDKATLIHAIYTGSTLTSVKSYELTFNSKKATQEVTAGKGSKFMLWDSLSGMEPIFDPLETDGSSNAANTATLTVEGLSDEGYPIIGEATWAVVDAATGEESEFVKITPDTTDSHKATIEILKGAASGDYKVTVSMGGKTKDITITATGTQESVKFTTSTSSIAIPMEEGASEKYQYEAAVVDANSKPIEGKTVTYAMYDKNNQAPLANTDAISFDAATATLTVTSAAEPTVVYIRATGTNSDDQTISRSLAVNIHGLAFDFGSNVAAEGYTAVTPTTSYTDANGYGIETGAPTANGDGTVENADSDSLKGAFTFKVKVPAAKVYNVTINYAGTVTSEYVNVDLTGQPYTNATKSSVTYEVPVIDDMMDLAFNASSEVSSIVIEKQSDKGAGLTPNIYTVGDSTIANNGSWAYVLARDYATKYTDLSEIATFTNNGRGGKNLSSYYTGGEFNDRILTKVRPGDYVVIGCMGTNGTGSNFEGSFNYYIDACEAMGAKIILNSYTPHMTDSYNATTHTFNGKRTDGYDNTVRKIYQERSTEGGEKYDPNVIGFIDIGDMADAAFNAYVAEGADDAAKEARAQEIIACAGSTPGAPDHNHYSNGTIACQLMLEGYKAVGDLPGADGIVKTLVEIITADLAE